jgi:hypothetical protein
MPPKSQDTAVDQSTVDVSEILIRTYRTLPEKELPEVEQSILQMRLDGWRIASTTATHSAQILIIWER